MSILVAPKKRSRRQVHERAVAREVVVRGEVLAMVMSLGVLVFCSSSSRNHSMNTEPGPQASAAPSSEPPTPLESAQPAESTQRVESAPAASAQPAGDGPSFDQSCSENTDCVGVPLLPGTNPIPLCTNCIVAAINKADKAKYDAWHAALGLAPKICPCPPRFVKCVSGKCEATNRPN